MASYSSKERTKSLIPRTFRAGAQHRQESAACSLGALLPSLPLPLGWNGQLQLTSTDFPRQECRATRVCEGICEQSLRNLGVRRPEPAWGGCLQGAPVSPRLFGSRLPRAGGCEFWGPCRVPTPWSSPATRGVFSYSIFGAPCGFLPTSSPLARPHCPESLKSWESPSYF